MRSPGIGGGSGRDAAEEPSGYRPVEPRTPTSTRLDLEEIIPSREGVGQATTTARDGPATGRGALGHPSRGLPGVGRNPIAEVTPHPGNGSIAMALHRPPLIVRTARLHGQLTDLRPQSGDLVVPVVGRPDV